MSDHELYDFDSNYDFDGDPARRAMREPRPLYGSEEEAFMDAFLNAYHDERRATVVAIYRTFVAALQRENDRRGKRYRLCAPSLRTFYRHAQKIRDRRLARGGDRLVAAAPSFNQ